MLKALCYMSLLFLAIDVQCDFGWDLEFESYYGWNPRDAESDLTCNPEVDCSNSNIGDKVPDPANCTNYYLCIDSGGKSVPSDVSLPCPEGSFYNLNESDCTPGTYVCSGNCINTCKAYCMIELDYLADPKNCSQYFVCVGGQKTNAFCAGETLYFNGEKCTSDPYACCDICTPYCFKPNTETFDPYNCSRFYMCLTSGVPTENNHFSCPNGQSFDPVLGVCVEGSNCTNLCG